MPVKMWKHRCRPSGAIILEAQSKCSSCGTAGEYDGWHLTMFEAMAWYQKRYGLKPVGPHRLLADELFSGATAACGACSGKGFKDINCGEGCRLCAKCEGAGTVFLLSPEERERLRTTVLDKYPDSAASFDLPNPCRAVVIQDLAKGIMAVVSESPEE